MPEVKDLVTSKVASHETNPLLQGSVTTAKGIPADASHTKIPEVHVSEFRIEEIDVVPGEVLLRHRC